MVLSGPSGVGKSTIVRRLREHRQHRPEQLQANVAEVAVAERVRRDEAEVAREHVRAAYVGRRLAGCLRDRLDDDPVERALPQLPDREPREDHITVDGLVTPPKTVMTDLFGTTKDVRVQQAKDGRAFVRVPLPGRSMAILTKRK